MRLMRILAITTVFLSLVFAQNGEKRTSGIAVYFLRDESHKQWCAYATESRFEVQIQALSAVVVGGADYVDGRLSLVRVTETDETGDWAVNDVYTYNKSGQIKSLKGTINILPEDSSEEQLFVIENGRVVKQQSVYRELRTGKASQKSVNWFKAPPVITTTGAFPFSDLIGSKRNEVRSKGTVCIP